MKKVNEINLTKSEIVGNLSGDRRKTKVIIDHGVLTPGSPVIAPKDAQWIDSFSRDLMTFPEADAKRLAQELRIKNPLFSFLARHKSSWPVMDAILTRGSSLWESPPNTSYSFIDRKNNPRLCPDWLIYNTEKMRSLTDIKIKTHRSLAVLDTGDLARGVNERALIFKKFWKESLIEKIIGDNKRIILGVDFASGSFRYGIEALAEIFEENPQIKMEIESGDRQILIFGLESDPAGVIFSNNLAEKFGVSNCVKSVQHHLVKLSKSFLSEIHPEIKNAKCEFDIVTSSGLLDYAHPESFIGIPSKAEFSKFFRELLAIGGNYANANITRLTPAYADLNSERTEHDFIKYLFDWIHMHELNPEEFYDVHVKSDSWISDEITEIVAPPSCGRNLDRSFYVLKAKKLGPK